MEIPNCDLSVPTLHYTVRLSQVGSLFVILACVFLCSCVPVASCERTWYP